MDAIPKNLRIQHYNTFKKIRHEEGEQVSDLPSSNIPVNYWFFGSTGSGKSHAARNEFPKSYLKVSNNKWWDGYRQGVHTTVIMDDFDISHNYMGFNLKIWADRYAFTAEVKGATLMLRPNHIIVTSNYHPAQIWPNDKEMTLDPILRRFKIVHFQRASGDDLSDSWRIDETRVAYSVV